MNLIEQLADLVGFHRSYINCFNHQVNINEQARNSLLQAMGYDLSSEQAILLSIRNLQQQSWRKMLPATHIVKEELSDHSITISLPVCDVSSLSWTIITEDTSELTNKISVADLATVDHAIFEDKALGKREFIKYQLTLPKVSQGYHKLTLCYGDLTDSTYLICAPKTCYSPQEANSEKMWGYAAQLYSLQSNNNWGMGDFSDLLSLVQKSAKQNASVIGLNPLHPLYQNNPAHRSPYSPTSRCFLNTIYIDVTKAPYFVESQPAQAKFTSQIFQDKLAYVKSTALIDYPAVADIKFEILEILYNEFLSHIKSDEALHLREEYEAFKNHGGEDLLRLATFDALYEHFRQKDFNAFGWVKWPKAFQSPDSIEVQNFKRDHQNRINYFIYLQWLAHRQLQEVAITAKESNMPIGLYLDLAVGCDGSGVDVWSDKDVYVAGAAVGAPPDAMNVLGQDWGLTPINPVELQNQGYMPLIKALRSNMQYAGALRIDHILGLMRQYWVAPGMKADQGVYISFPFEDILRIIALESRRNNCVVIGEDLGTVPDGFSEKMAAAGLLSYKVLFFEKWESGFFKRPELYPSQSMVTVSTHDLPTLSSWWTGRDLEWRQQLKLYPNEEMGQAERTSRVDERQLLIAALNDLNTIDMNKAPSDAPAIMNRELSIATQKFLATANSHIQLIPLEDALEVNEQVNIPGTIDEHPNWLQKLPLSLAQWEESNAINELVSAMQHARPRN